MNFCKEPEANPFWPVTAPLEAPASCVNAEKSTVAEMGLAGGEAVPAGMLSVAVEVPVVVGSGVRVSASPTNFSQGTLQETGVSTDVAIQGQGFLIASQGGQSYYTRAGNLQLDANGK